MTTTTPRTTVVSVFHDREDAREAIEAPKDDGFNPDTIRILSTDKHATEEMAAQGYRLLQVSGYNVGGQDDYAAIWEQRDGPGWQGRHGLMSGQYQRTFNSLVSEGYRLTGVSGFVSGA